ncbi:MAG: galactose oxidase-like domain-containing protein [Gemmatimonadales bacterium]
MTRLGRSHRYCPPLWLTAILVAGSITCAHDTPAVDVEKPPAAIRLVAGDAQSGVVGQPLADSLVVEVVDADGVPVHGMEVEFRVTAEDPGAEVAPEKASTDPKGRAAARVVLGTVAGSWIVEARVTGAASQLLVARVTATAAAGTPDTVRAVSGQDQGGRVGSMLSDSLAVEVVDAFGNVTAGTEVSWEVSGGGTVSGATTMTAANGRAAVQRQLGSAAGDQATTATVAGVKGSPVTFHHVAVAGDASALLPVSGGGQTEKVGTELRSPIVAKVVDPDGNAIPGKTVTWSAGQGGSADPETVTTGADGIAATVWTLGGSLGAQTLTASAAGLGNVGFTASGTPGNPAQAAIIIQPSSSAVNGVALGTQPKVELRDFYGNPTVDDGVTVTAALATNPGGTLGGTVTANTVDGQATFSNLKITGTTGTYTVKFSSSGLSGGTSGPITLAAGTPSSLTMRTQPSTTAVSGDPFSRQPVVEVRDAGGNLLNGSQVTATIQSGGGTLSGTAVITSVNGVATFTDLAIGGAGGSRTLRFTSASAGVTSSSVSVSAPAETSAGEWSAVKTTPIIAVHMSLLPDGDVLMFGRKDDPQLFDPATGQFTAIPSPAWLFCSGHAFLPDGRLLIAGGHITNDHGLPASTLYDWRTRSFSSGPPMPRGRWYPTVTPLPNGEMVVVAGRDENGLVVPIPDVWTTGGAWRQLSSASLTQPYYPRMFVAPNGNVFEAGPSQASHWLTTSGSGSWVTTVKSARGYRDYGSAVMYAPGKIMIVGGGGADSNSAPTSTAEVIDLNQGSPAWRSVQSMQYARRHMNATILPTGEVLVTGGTSASGFNNPEGGVHAAELWDPQTEHWTTLASNQVTRVYHSTTLLLLDGRVLHSGSGEGSGAPEQYSYEVFSPPYLFKGARPTIGGAPATVSYGQQFTVSTPDAAGISKVSFIKLGSVTHAFDENQRFLSLSFTKSSGSLTVTAPASGNVAPPGHYMLFILNEDGVPSVAKVVRIQ